VQRWFTSYEKLKKEGMGKTFRMHVENERSLVGQT
jgi:hypothetical protein